MREYVRKCDGSRRGERIIRPGGRVKWCKRWFRLDDAPANVSPAEYEAMPMDEKNSIGGKYCPKYDGRMDGMVGHFYDYGKYSPLENHIYLHSILPGRPYPGPTCVGGVFVWERFLAEPA